MRGADDIVAAIDKRLAAARQLVERLEQARAALVADSQGPPAAEAPVGIVQPAKPRPVLTAVAPAANAKAVLSKTPKQRTEGARTKQAILSTVRMAGDSGLMLGQIVERAGVSLRAALRHKPATIGDLAGRLDIKLDQVRDVVNDMIVAGDAREHPALGVILTSVA